MFVSFFFFYLILMGSLFVGGLPLSITLMYKVPILMSILAFNVLQDVLLIFISVRACRGTETMRRSIRVGCTWRIQ